MTQNQSVCEIGAGLGIASMAAALAGQKEKSSVYTASGDRLSPEAVQSAENLRCQDFFL